MNIKDVEQITGISKQNIRYYEACKLLSVKRNEENAYREYDEDDIRRLKLIKFLRTLDFSVEQIKEILSKNQIVNLNNHISELIKRRERLDGSIEICEKLDASISLKELDLDYYLDLIESGKKEGKQYISFMDDYKAYFNYRAKKKFSFIPNNMCMTKEEFKEALLEFAESEGKEITILKESMYPEFIYDGCLYKAERNIGRYGAVVKATLLDEESLEKPKLEGKRKLKVLLLYYLPLIIISIIFVILVFLREGPLWLKFLLLFGDLAVMFGYGIYWKDNLRG